MNVRACYGEYNGYHVWDYGYWQGGRVRVAPTIAEAGPALAPLPPRETHS